MLNILKFIGISVLISLFFYGCHTEKIIVIEDGNSQTNTVMKAGFGGEHYIWETWFFSTNKVETLK